MTSSSMSANLSDRMKLLLGTANRADIQFLVGEEKELFRAHKHILTLTSDVFEAMFHDTKNAKTEAELPNPVEMPDVEAAAFKVMLSFIYAADLSKLDGKNAMAVLYAAKKYGINGLIGQCLQKISILNLSNVFLAFVQARLLDLEELMDPSKGFYNKAEDKVTLAIDIFVEEQKGTKKRKLFR
ncbi:hypothetical protein niasHS_004501 [Heterodera schachtii]|uniref:BTB domain-containing protein n=1 Tax=Heterodera schachtii TaxID=97005 RepID=A0ABD2JMD8_HETSC